MGNGDLGFFDGFTLLFYYDKKLNFIVIQFYHCIINSSYHSGQNNRSLVQCL